MRGSIHGRLGSSPRNLAAARPSIRPSTLKKRPSLIRSGVGVGCHRWSLPPASIRSMRHLSAQVHCDPVISFQGCPASRLRAMCANRSRTPAGPGDPAAGRSLKSRQGCTADRTKDCVPCSPGLTAQRLVQLAQQSISGKPSAHPLRRPVSAPSEPAMLRFALHLEEPLPAPTGGRQSETPGAVPSAGGTQIRHRRSHGHQGASCWVKPWTGKLSHRGHRTPSWPSIRRIGA